MFNLSFGEFTQPVDDAQREIAWVALQPLKALGYPEGETVVNLDGRRSMTIHLGRKEAAMLRLVERILTRVIEGNRTALGAAARRTTPEAVIVEAWRATLVVKNGGFRHGAYLASLGNGLTAQFSVGRWDAALLFQLETYLTEIVERNREQVEAVMSEDALLTPKVEQGRYGRVGYRAA